MTLLLKDSSTAVDTAPGDATATVSRRMVWIAAIVILGVVGVLVLRLTQAVNVKKAGPAKIAIPTVTVTRMDMISTPTTVQIIGTINARYDMPIGVEGDAGRISAIYVEAGDRVKRGQLLAKLNVSVLAPQVANLKAALEQSQAEAELADAEYHRALAVGASGALSVEDTQRRKSSSVTAAAKVKVAAAMLAEAEARLARADIRAPADGIILTRNCEVGQTATAGGDALFRLSENGDVELRGQVSEQDLPLLKVGQAVSVRLTGNETPYPGEVRLLGAVIDPQTRLGTVRVALRPDPNLRPGAFARADVTVSNAQRAVLPQTAVLTDDRGSYVLVVTPEHTLERRAVHVAGIAGNGVTISEGLSAHDSVVATAGAFLREGERVEPVAKEAGA